VEARWQSGRVTTAWQSSRPRHGRRFQPTHELALYGPALAACQAIPGAHRGLLVVAEASGPMGIPDLTALVGAPDPLEHRLALDVPPLLNEIDAAVVAVAHPGVGRSAAKIAASLGWPATTVERRLPGLIKNGALSRVRGNKFVRAEELKPLGRLYAVETKMRDRRAALRQARAYATWADSYVLVMGTLSPTARSQLLQDVEADQAGLVVNGKWLRRPVVRAIPVARRLWAAEFLVAALRGGPTSPR
jgi:hypothetical protein